MKSWNREVFGRVEVKKSEALRKVHYFDQKEKKNLITLKEAADRFLLKRITNIGPYGGSIIEEEIQRTLD